MTRSSSDDNNVLSGLVDDVLFSHNRPHNVCRLQIYVSAVLQLVISTYSPGCATLFDIAVYSGSEQCTADVSDDDMRGAAIGWWPAACRIKAGGEVCFLRLPCSRFFNICNFVSIRRWQWRNFFMSYLCQLLFRPCCRSSSAKCFLFGHHFLSKIATILTFS